MIVKSMFFVSFFTLFIFPVFASGDFCVRCEKVQEYHSQNPSEYDYYEDYLKAVEEGKVNRKDADEVMKEIEQNRPSDAAPLFKTKNGARNRSLPFRKVEKDDKSKKQVAERTRYWPFKKTPRAEG